MTYPDLSCQNTLTTHYRHITTADTRQMQTHYIIRNKKARRLHNLQASRLKYITL